MANIMMKINKKAEEMFNTIHIMDQSFAIRWKNELEHTWYQLDYSGNMHSVIYNQDLTKLRDFYGLTTNHQVTLTHFGHSVFLLTIFKSNYEPKTYPKWHSLYHQVPNSVTFKVLTEYKVTCNSLVNVLSTMYSFMKVARFTHLNLECRIVYNQWRKTAKIGNGWRSFAQSQNLQTRTQIMLDLFVIKVHYTIVL
ncbi:hypothetical protein GmHk_15G043945 [Glycine max]|nr:hypothetical protein GmHk_15G043945 [Glycine max]